MVMRLGRTNGSGERIEVKIPKDRHRQLHDRPLRCGTIDRDDFNEHRVA